MPRRKLFEPGTFVSTFTGQVGVILSQEGLQKARRTCREGRRPGHYFAPGCCQNPDYVLQVPVLFEDSTFDIMRAMNVRKGADVPAEKQAHLKALLDEPTGQGENLVTEEVLMEDCIFCKIVAGQIPCIRIYEDEKVLSFLDINPISEGHTLVIPKAHAENLWQINEEDLAAVHKASKKIIQAMKEVLNPEGVACLQSNGSGVNQVVMHYHLHLIPRTRGSEPLPVSSWELKPGDQDALARLAQKIATRLG
jgi:histidine triad (HIT) family protein